jgi:hypothetical protein
LTPQVIFAWQRVLILLPATFGVFKKHPLPAKNKERNHPMSTQRKRQPRAKLSTSIRQKQNAHPITELTDTALEQVVGGITPPVVEMGIGPGGPGNRFEKTPDG